MTTPAPPNLDSGVMRGNVTYTGGTSAPTTGTVDPMGYVDRSLNNPSTSRSGLAGAMLSRLASAGQTAAPATTPAPTTTNTAANGLQVQQIGGTGQYIPKAIIANGANPPSTSTAAANTPTPTPTSTTGIVPPHTYSPDGSPGAAYVGTPEYITVHLPDGTTQQEMYKPTSAADALDKQTNGLVVNSSNFSQLYDPAINAQINALDEGQVQNNANLQLALQQKLGLNTLNQQNAQSQDPYSQENVLARYGGRGMANSSGYQNALEQLLGQETQRDNGYALNAQNDQTNYQIALQNALNKYNEQKGVLDATNASYAQNQLATNGTSIVDAINQQFGLHTPTYAYTRNSTDGGIYQVAPDGTTTHLTPDQYAALGSPAWTSTYTAPAGSPPPQGGTLTPTDTSIPAPGPNASLADTLKYLQAIGYNGPGSSSYAAYSA